MRMWRAELVGWLVLSVLRAKLHCACRAQLELGIAITRGVKCGRCAVGCGVRFGFCVFLKLFSLSPLHRCFFVPPPSIGDATKSWW